jgi:hypothetical protein
MAKYGDEERCIAKTGSGGRCSRVAKDDGFCFQHDRSYDTVEIQTAQSAGVVNWLSSELESRAAQASDIQRDVYMNLVDMQSSLANVIDDFKSGNASLDTVLKRFSETAEDVGGGRSQNTAAGAVIGGIAGAPLGPAGIYAGIVAGSSISFFMTPKDERTIIAIPVGEVPDDAEVVSSNDPAIESISAIQLVVESAADGEEEDWVRETNTRSWDMDEAESALDDLPKYEADDSPPGGYYIRDVKTGQVVVLIFGIPDEDFPTS